MKDELKISTLGGLSILHMGKPVGGLASRKAEALLIYLACTRRAHSREALATLFWEEYSQTRALTNLRVVLSSLRRHLKPFLKITRDTAALDPESDVWLDAAALEDQLSTVRGQRVPISSTTANKIEQALPLYRGDFLEGFYVLGSRSFEEWVSTERQRLYNLVLDALSKLVTWYLERGEYSTGIARATRLLQLDPLMEEAHQQLMRLLAYSGQRGAALKQYGTLRRILEENLGVEPAEETTRLYEQIHAGELAAPEPVDPGLRDVALRLPAFLEREEPAIGERPVFVARERELERLNGYLELALNGHGQVAFVTGGGGRGKTALVGEFARRSQEAHQDLIVVMGECNAYSGIGDPYLPFRDVIDMLSGDVESHWATGAITGEHARRLWDFLPSTVQALVEHGPGLINALVPGEALLSRAMAVAPGKAIWLEQVKRLAEQGSAVPGGLEQAQLFTQYANVLRALASERPLLLVLDDLQWADATSVSLLFHLGRRLKDSRILFIGAYRADEVASGRGGKHHPLEKVLAEFKRRFGDVHLDLGEIDGGEARRFVDALLDTEPNRLGEAFRERLLHHTQGHPLFMVELLRSMQERGGLVQDEDGQWVEGTTLEWGKLPARVEGVIEERIGRLGGKLREALTVASVEGEVFTVQAVAHVGKIDELDLVQQLRTKLDRQHRLVEERGSEQLERQRLFFYRFRHILIQQYLYNQLGEFERLSLHNRIGAALEELYREQVEVIAPKLAWHYSEAGEVEKATGFLLMAGDQARLLYAHQEAIELYERALALLKEKGEYERAGRTLMKLGLTHHSAFNFPRARQAYEEGFSLWQRAGAMQPAVSPSPEPLTLRIVWNDPPTLDPTRAWDLYSASVIDQLFSGLVELTPEMDIVPAVARTWEMLEDGCKYLFHLRNDVRWSDDTPVRAQDFEYAWKRLLNPATGSHNAHLLFDIKGARAFYQGTAPDAEHVGVQAQDEVTLFVELEEPTSYFLSLMAHRATYPVPRHIVEQHGEAWAELENIVTNGPFRLVDWQPGQSLVLASNPQYYGQITGNVGRVRLSLLTDPSAILNMYETNRLDLLNLGALIAPDRNRARREHASEYVSAPSLGTMYVGFNVRKPPFNDPRCCQAIVLATDRNRLADVVMGGHPFPATGSLVPPGMPGHSAGIGLRYDPEGARRLLSEAGYPGGRDFPAVMMLAFSGLEPQVQYLQSQWQENLGLEISCETMKYGLFLERMTSERPHMFLSGWTADYPDPDNFLRVSPIQQYTQWQNEAFNELVNKAKRVTDQGERLQLYGQADRTLVEEAAIMPLLYMRLHLLVKPWVRRFPTSAISYWFWKDVVIEPH